MYSSTTTKMASCKYLYLGTHATYSDECQLKAVMRGDYSDLHSFIEDRRDCTSPAKHVFYCLNPSYPVLTVPAGITRNKPGASPYFIIGSLSKLFEKEEENVDFTKFKMYNDPKKDATLENVQLDMEASAFFNKVDFSKSKEKAKLSYDMFESFYGHIGKSYDHPLVEDLQCFPFSRDCENIFLTNNKWPCGFTVQSYGSDCGKPGKYLVVKARQRNDWINDWIGFCSKREYAEATWNGGDKEQREACKKIYSQANPMVTQFVFCNGNKVPAFQNFMLNCRTKYNDIG